VRVKLATHDQDWRNFDKEKVTLLLKPVVEAASPPIIELSLPFPCKSDEAVRKALPCLIRLTNNPDEL
jgi:hypothetical protein